MADLADSFDGRHRRGKGLSGDFDQEDFGDAHRERHVQGEHGAFATFGADDDLPAPLFDHFVDHVHADTASRQLREGFGGGEAGAQDEAAEVAFVIGTFRVKHAFGGRFVTDSLVVEALTVVEHVHREFGRVHTNFDFDGASLGFTGRETRFRRFDAVRQRVANHVFERGQDVFQQAAFDFNFAAFKDEVDVLADAFRGLAHQAAQSGFVDIEAHQLGGEQVVLNTALDNALLDGKVAQGGVVLTQGILQVFQVVNGLGELP